jgi:hypothetical protein
MEAHFNKAPTQLKPNPQTCINGCHRHSAMFRNWSEQFIFQRLEEEQINASYTDGQQSHDPEGAGWVLHAKPERYCSTHLSLY